MRFLERESVDPNNTQAVRVGVEDSARREDSVFGVTNERFHYVGRQGNTKTCGMCR